MSASRAQVATGPARHPVRAATAEGTVVPATAMDRIGAAASLQYIAPGSPEQLIPTGAARHSVAPAWNGLGTGEPVDAAPAKNGSAAMVSDSHPAFAPGVPSTEPNSGRTSFFVG